MGWGEKIEPVNGANAAKLEELLDNDIPTDAWLELTPKREDSGELTYVDFSVVRGLMSRARAPFKRAPAKAKDTTEKFLAGLGDPNDY